LSTGKHCTQQTGTSSSLNKGPYHICGLSNFPAHCFSTLDAFSHLPDLHPPYLYTARNQRLEVRMAW